MTTPEIGSSGSYTDINGIKTWHDSFGSGPPLVLLHGGMSSSMEWEPLVPAFAEHFTVHRYDRRAHGRTEDPGTLSYASMADDLVTFLESVVREPAHLVGWSDGGNIALAVAARRPALVVKIVPFGANIEPDGVLESAAQMFRSTPADSPMFEGLRSGYEALSPDGPGHWAVFYEKFLAMALDESALDPADLSRIVAPTLVVAGDDDMVKLEHTASIFNGISNAQLAIIPGASHLLQMEKPELFLTIVKEFLLNDPAPTMMPFRRGHG